MFCIEILIKFILIQRTIIYHFVTLFVSYIMKNAVSDSNFAKDPFKLKRPEGMSIEAYHTKRQQNIIEGYIDQFGTTLVGLGRILNRAHIAAMHRDARYSGSNQDQNKLRKKMQASEERATAGPTGGDMIEQY